MSTEPESKHGGSVSLAEKLDKIKSPKLQNQREV